MSGSLLRKITRQISPHHNPEGITFGKSKTSLEKSRTSAKPISAAELYAATLVTKLTDELKYEVEHVEKTAILPVAPKREKKQDKKAEPAKQRSKARLTGARVAELVEAAGAMPEGMFNCY
ncbi:LANO_0E11694g1_1 [Lachancea nothofagi CBS 11611]|uniref:LANO_0E11694g1_1 n=1 Tax=Lachancea nothofagi CBS 11611 TaxID=1266666 RepID=A0A1G4JXK7_9SACH|nr:LANO_0E11694g1_1 [Lachancea nothofagi CBS 11611]